MIKKIVFVLVLALLAGCAGLREVNINHDAVPPEGTPLKTDNPSPTDLSEFSAAPPQEKQRQGAEFFQDGLVKQQQNLLAEIDSFNQYQINLNISDDFSKFSGEMDLFFVNQDAALDTVYFHIFPNYQGGNFKIDQVKVDGADAVWWFESLDTILAVDLAKTVGMGEETLVSITFSCLIPQEMGGNYGLFGYFDGVLVLDTFYPTLAVLDEEGWHAGYPDPVGDLTVADASFYVVNVDAPAGVIFAASGQAVSQTEKDGRQKVVFVAGPARDFYLAGSRDYGLWQAQVGEITVNSYAFAQYEKAGLLALETAQQALTIFSERYGAYPYTEFDVISSPMMALGIEYPGITGISLNLYVPDGTTDQNIILESVVAHEVGHQWFYNMVGNDQQDEPWLDESLTQFVTGVYYEDRYGAAAAQQYRLSWDTRWQRVDREAIPLGRNAESYAGAAYSAIIYGRGPYFFMQLRETLGEADFERLMKVYVDEYAWKISSTEAFRTLAEETCACDLSELFETWVYEP